jgi:multidrug transporter EmrE-like cation transporter
MILNGVFITILSYCLFNEKVSKSQMIGIITVAISVAIVSIFGPEVTD